jgi:hypothetical protein
MKFSLAVFLFAALLASGALASTSSSPGKEQVLYGHVTSVTRDGSSYRLHVDPAWWLTGVAAEHACGCKPVPNDHVVIDETHRLLTFAVRKDAPVTVLVRGRSSGKVTISVAELAQIVQGKNPRHRRLLEPRAAFWIRVLQTYPSPVVALDQQYQP